MEALKHTYHQYLAIYRSLSASQRLSLLLVVALVVGALGYLAFSRSSAAYVPASLGKNFNSDELQNAETILREKGLANFKFEGNQLLVPRGEVDRYNAALLEEGGLPHDWASELEKQFEKQGWFPSDRQSRLRKEIALGKELRRIIRAIPDVADGRVVWARTEPRRFSGKTGKVTATVNIKPKPGRELSLQLVHSLRQAVANMISGLKPEDVTIFNLQTGQSYTAEEEGPFDNQLIDWIKQHTRLYKEKVEQQLSFIPDVLVSVDVQVDNLESWIEQSRKYDQKNSVITSETSQTSSQERNDLPPPTEAGVRPNEPRRLNTQQGTARRQRSSESDKSSTTIPGYTTTLKKYIAAMPKAVHVSVGIPEEYFEQVASKQGGGTSQSGAAGRDQILADIKRLVAHTVGADPDSDAVEVRPYVRMDRELPELNTPWTETAMFLLSRWGGPIGLGLFALLALWMVKRNMPEMPEIEHDPLPAFTPPPQPTEQSPNETEAEEPSPATPKTTERDRLQNMVRDNPEMTAAVIGEWLSAANESS